MDLHKAVLPGDLAESGRGLALVRMAVDDFSYRHSDGIQPLAPCSPSLAVRDEESWLSIAVGALDDDHLHTSAALK